MAISIKITSITRWAKKYLPPAFLLALLIFFISFAESENRVLKCTGVEVLLHDRENSFVKPAEIEATINSNELLNSFIHDIDYAAIENILYKIPFLKNSEVFNNIEGKVFIKVEQRTPVFRVINTYGESYYVDKDGIKFPTSTHHTAHVIIASGNIREKLNSNDTIQSSQLKQVFELAKFLAKTPEYASIAGHIEINNENDMIIIPRVGNQKVILGNTENLDNKFKRLIAFYKNAAPVYGWNTYKTLNLKYKNQIIANK